MNYNERAHLVLVTGDLHIPQRVNELNDEVKNILQLKRFDYVLSTGNIGNRESLDFLKSICIKPDNNFHIIKGEIDNDEFKEFNFDVRNVKIGEFVITIINGYQIVPWEDYDDLYSMAIENKSDVIVYGFSGVKSVVNYEGISFINPGSLTGAYSPFSNDTLPGFMVLLINADVCDLYQYELNSSKNFDIQKYQIFKSKN